MLNDSKLCVHDILLRYEMKSSSIYVKGGPNVYSISCFQSCKQHFVIFPWGENYYFLVTFQLTLKFVWIFTKLPLILWRLDASSTWGIGLRVLLGEWEMTQCFKNKAANTRWTIKCESPSPWNFVTYKTAAVSICETKQFLLHLSNLPGISINCFMCWLCSNFNIAWEIRS